MNSKDYQKVLDAVTTSAVYVIREDNHGILYYNKRVREVTPEVRTGIPCHELWTECCANCPLLTIGDKEESRSVSNGSSFGDVVDITATRILWDDEIPAFIITVSPHTEVVRGVYRVIMRVNLGNDTYNVVKENSGTVTKDSRAGSFSEWVDSFIKSGDIYHDDVERFLNFIRPEQIQKAIQEGNKTLACSYRRHTSEGFHWNIIELIRDAGYSEKNQAITLLVKDVQDVDERMRMELKLSQQDMQMAAILKSRYKVITTVHLNSGQCERMWIGEDEGLKKVYVGDYAHYFQRAIGSVVYPEDAQRFQEMLSPEHLRQQAERAENYLEETCQYRIKEDSIRWLEQHIIYIRKGGEVQVNILGRDITRKKLKEQKRQEADQARISIIQSLSSMFFATYYGNLEEGTFNSVTQLKKVGKVLGKQVNYEDALHTYAENFVHPDDRKEYLDVFSLENMRKSLKPEQPFITFSYRKLPDNPEDNPEDNPQDKDYGWVRATSVLAQTDENGKARLFVYVAQDITESKIRELRGQQALQAACEAADRANASKSEFLSRMSHDLRTPMNGILGMIQIASRHMDDPARLRDCIDKINESSGLLLSLVNKMLDMSQIESGNIELETKSFGLSEMIEKMKSIILPSVEDKGLRLEIHPIEVEHELVIGDELRIQQIFLHILENAVKYTPKGGVLELSVLEQDSREYGCGSYDFIFADNGIGMEEDFLPHIFEPFSRAQDSRINKIEGAGLGMTIANNIVNMMGGNITVESKIGCGSRFTVTLLLKQQSHEGKPGKAPDGNVETLSIVPFQGKRILLVEDNELNREIAMEIIGETGALVECAENGLEGLDRFAGMPEEYYDLVFMDIQMPVMNGYEAARAIRKLPRSDAASIPILALSANAFAEDIAASRAAGMNEHLPKPLDIPRLMASMHYWLEGDKEKKA